MARLKSVRPRRKPVKEMSPEEVRLIRAELERRLDFIRMVVEKKRIRPWPDGTGPGPITPR